jgi:hypothetical protein
MKKILIILGLLFYLSIGYCQITISSANCTSNNTRPMGGGNRCAQSFTSTPAILDSVKFYLWREVGVSGNIYAKLFGASGSYTEYSPSNDSFAVSDAKAATDITVWPTKGWVTLVFSGANKYQFTGSSIYTIVLSSIDVGAGTYSAGSNSKVDSAGSNLTCHLGNLIYSTAAWQVYKELDMLFYIYGSTIPTATDKGQVIIISR